MSNLLKNLFRILPLYLLPTFAFAQPNSFSELIYENIISLVSSVIPIIVSIALLIFFWGIAQFIFNSGEGKNMEKAKDTMLWGVIALFVMLSVWGLVSLLQNTFGL